MSFMVTLIIFGTRLQENIYDYEKLFENRLRYQSHINKKGKNNNFKDFYLDYRQIGVVFY